MIRQLFKIIWNRRRHNALILTEIVLAFLVLCAVMVMVTVQVQNYNLPLGFSIDNIWSVDVDPHLPGDSLLQQIREGMRVIHSTLGEMPEIEAVAAANAAPYAHSVWISGVQHEGRTVDAHMNHGTDGLKELLGIEVTRGRWFTSDDDAAGSNVAVINERLAADLYGNADPLGKELPFDKRRVVGVVRDYRRLGEFSQPVNTVISRISPNDTTNDWATSTILIRVKAGTTSAFQERLVRSLEAAERGWTFRVTRLEQARQSEFKEHLAPVVALSIIAGFLLFMVALGLIGVLWQNVSQRTNEIGLRRALGGTARSVYAQILGELLVLTTFGLGIGLIIVAQFPLLGVVSEVPPEAYAWGFAASAALMYILTFVSGFYPSWLTMDVRPAEALHYD